MRKQWIQEVAKLDPSRLVFIDESGAKTNMTCLRGRALGGNRLFTKTPHGHWCTTTLISSVRLDGTTAAMEGEGATETAFFSRLFHLKTSSSWTIFASITIPRSLNSLSHVGPM
ncbi:MAG: hypothetical protein GKR87_03190 [Kiritimatiellae bacterium]|nr:hypothetical protein [Kiritimatiellia bacterium]